MPPGGYKLNNMIHMNLLIILIQKVNILKTNKIEYENIPIWVEIGKDGVCLDGNGESRY